MNQLANPLDIPEILSRVGMYIPLWVYPDQNSTRNRRPRFTPQHLLNCILVSRTWYNILLPILWFTFDDISIPSVFRSEQNLIRHGRHLRILELSRPIPAVPLKLLPHNLLHLDLSRFSNNARAKDLVLQNTRLQSLHWQGGDFHRDDYGTLDAKALSKRLRRLQDLHLECWKLDKGFMNLLRRNPGLRRLALEYVTGEIYQTRALDNHCDQEAANDDSNNDDKAEDGDEEEEEEEEEEQGGEIQLSYLSTLTVCKDVGSGTLEELVRLCPRLEELSWTGSTDSDLRQLTKNLRDCCPGLSALTYSTVEINEDESAYATLIQSIPRLVELLIRIPTLGDRFTDALVKHAPTLEILDLKIENHHGLSHANLKRILTSCHQITALSIEGSRWGADLFSFDWACLRLSRLLLQGLYSMTRGQVAEADNASVATIYGWTATASETEAGMERTATDTIRPYGETALMHKVSAGFFKKLLLHLQAMVHLQSFVLNGVEYTRQPFV
ncbi:hypothetical protein BGX34_003941 [Mortierella sp. NVP85]|nr:hypothetical protein BGX34_003941 [Mortierella sp. NVP85]